MMDHKVGVIPFDIKGDRIAIMFVTSQGRGRWILPKGNLKNGETAKRAAAAKHLRKPASRVLY